MFIKDAMRDCMSRKKTKRKRRKLRDKIDPDEELNLLLADIELDLYLACMELDKKRKRRDYIV